MFVKCSRAAVLRAAGTATLLLTLAACGGSNMFNRDGVITDSELSSREAADAQRKAYNEARLRAGIDEDDGTIWDLFTNSERPDTTVKVNKYLWQSSLDVLNFLPVETVDPFTGVISTGYGTPPGGRSAYRATIYISDPALDARSLKVSLQTRGGGSVAPDTQRAVEDAILTRARQLRQRDSNL